MKTLKRNLRGVFIFAAVLSAAAQDVREGYAVPRFAIPRAPAAPTIDGTIDASEWQGALHVNLTQQLGSREVSAMQTTWCLMWDADNLYVAMRSPLRAGERPIQGQRRRDRDYNVVWDDSYDFWLDVGSNSPDGQPVYFQFLSNFAGARYDCLFEPQVGNSRLGWTSQWAPVNRVTPDGSAWEMEMVVPRASVYGGKPFADGQELRMLLARNFKRPWLQNSITGQSDFTARDSYARFTLATAAPAVHLTAVGDPAANTFGLALGAFAKKVGKVRWSFATETGVQRVGELELKAGQTVALPPQLALAPAAPGKHFRVRVETADGKLTLADWSAKMNYSARGDYAKPINDRGDHVNLSATLNPVCDYIRVSGDFIQYDNRAALARVTARILDAAGKLLGEAEFKIDELAYAGGTVQLPNLPPGELTIAMACLDADGKVLLTRDAKVTKLDAAKEFPWWNTKWGRIDRVVPPWTPVQAQGDKAEVWGRTMTIGAGGLPTQITTQGRELLARPATLVAELADGTTATLQAATCRTISAAEHQAIYEATGTLGDLTVTGRVTVMFDGIYKVELAFQPGQPLAIKSLQAVFPMRNEFAHLVHGSGEGIRYGFDVMAMPAKGRGRLWDSRRVDGQPMKVGSFIPFVWLGHTPGGLAWFADSDEGWLPNDNHPAIEVRRTTPESTDLVLNLISEPVTLDAPRRIVFGLQATPVKPLRPGWRDNQWTFDATFHDFSGITTLPGKQHSDLIWNAVPYVIDADYAKKKAADWQKSRGLAVPYFENNVMGKFRPEVDYFGEHWKASIGNMLWFDKTLQDFIVHSLAEWVQLAGIDGWYVDNVRPEACANLEAGRGYRLPDGRVQPTYQIFEQRDYWMRVRAAFIEAGKNPPLLVLHMTHNMVIPWIGIADLALDHEANVIFPEMGKDFMDVWSLDRLRLDYPGQWGVGVISMSKYDGDWSKASKEILERNWRSYVGANRLHDTLVQSHNDKDAKIRQAFGSGAADVQFRGYWEPENPVATPAAQIKASSWARPGKLLVIVTNWGDDTTAELRFDEERAQEWLGPLSGWKITEPESGQALPADRTGRVSLPIPKHHYRYLLIEPAGE